MSNTTTTFHAVSVPRIPRALPNALARALRSARTNPTVALVALIPLAVVLSPVVLAFAVVLGGGYGDAVGGDNDAKASL